MAKRVNPPEPKDAAFVKFWVGQLDAYYEEYKAWEERCDKIVQRYRDDRAYKSNGEYVGGARFNALWSNIQTLQPAIYIKPPAPVIERRYLDKDPLARFSSMTLERSLEVTIEQCGFHSSTKRAVMDYLLCGRGVTWERYEPTYGTPEDMGPTPADNEGQATALADRAASGEEDGEPTEAALPVTWEKVYTDYVGFKNFRHSPSPTWDEVTWVSKRDYLTRKELRTRFKEKDKQTGKPVADLIPLETDYDQTARQRRDTSDSRPKSKNKVPRACVWEIWDKTSRKVIFVAPGYEAAPLEVTDDPLNLQEFWPCAKPLYATITNDTLIPVPDYAEYQVQADELDNLTARITSLTDAVRVNGVYDASIPALKRILQEGAENRMIGVANYSELASKGGITKAIEFLPLKDIVDALLQLYEARERVKADMAEITGLSDIVRGQAQGGTKTATEQRIKGQFATLRLDDRKAEVQRFCRDNLAICAEVIAEQFSPEILAEMTGMISFIADEIKNDPAFAQAPPQAPQMGHNGGPPLDNVVPFPAPPASPPGVGAPGGATPPAAAGAQPDPQELAKGIFAKCVELLKSDKMRTFRIDVETDSTIEVDRQQAKEAVVELFTAIGGFLEKALQAAAIEPALAPALGQSMLFAFRQFGVGRDVEGAWEQAIDKIATKAKNPPPQPPSPEEIKAQAEMQKQQAESQRQQEQAQIDREKAAQEMQAAQQKQQLEMEKMQAELQMQREEMQIMREKMGMELQAKREEITLDAQAAQQQASIDEQAMQRQSEQSESEHARAMEAGDHKHKLDMETAEFKAKQAKKPKETAA